MKRRNGTRSRRGHEGKAPYPTLQLAQAAAAGLARRKDRQGNRIVTWLRAYRCTCGSFHIGKSRSIDWSRVT